MERLVAFLFLCPCFLFTMDMYKKSPRFKLKRIKESNHIVNYFDINARLSFLALGIVSGAIEIYSQDTGNLRCNLSSSCKSSVRSMAFCGKSPYLASGSEKGHLCVWDVNKSECFYKVKGKSPVNSVAYKDADVMIGLGKRQRVILFDIRDKKSIGSIELNKNVQDLVFYSNNKVMIGTDAGLYSYLLTNYKKPYKTFSEKGNYVSVSAQKKRLAYCEYQEGVVGIVDKLNDAHAKLNDVFLAPASVAVDPKAQRLAVAGGKTGFFRILDMNTKKSMQVVKVDGVVNDVAWGKNSEKVYVLSDNKIISSYRLKEK